MDIDWIHRPSAPGAGDGTLNLCFNALDRHVVHGRADETALHTDGVAAGPGELTYAGLLEEVAALGGVLRAFGTGAGDTVVARLPWDRYALVAVLASARVGARHEVQDSGRDPGEVTLMGADGTVRAVLRRGIGPDRHGTELDWDLALRAGRTDPAPCAEVPETSVAFVVTGREITAGEAARLLADEPGDGGRPEWAASWPFDALATLLAGGLVVLSTP